MALNGYIIPGIDSQALATHVTPAVWYPFYQLVRVDGKVLYAYPVGSSVLSVPFVAVLNLFELSAADRAGHFLQVREFIMEVIVASMLMAALVCVFAATANILLSDRASRVIALLAGFGTPIWSSASRTMWSHTWEILLTGCAVLIIVRAAEQRDRMRPVMLATTMAWAYFVRPTGLLAIAGVTVYMTIEHRRELFVYVTTGLVWLAGFLAYCLVTYGQLIPDYYRQGSSLSTSSFARGLAGVLISPSRGLLIFVPIAIVPIYLVIRYWRFLPHKVLALIAAGIIAENIGIVASWLSWWGGWSFGPRLLTDTIPWFVLLAILGWKGRENYWEDVQPASPESASQRLFMAFTALLALVSVAMNGWGAISRQPLRWNKWVDVNAHPERLWDWRSPQFLAGVIAIKPETEPRH